MLVRNQSEHQAKLQAQMERDGLDAMLITVPEAIYYCSGFASQFMYITNRIGMTLAIVPAHGNISLVVSEFEKKAAQQVCQDVNIVSYPVWIYIADIPDDGREKDAQPDMNLPFQLAAEIIRDFKADARVGIQMESMPFQKWEFLCNTFGLENLTDAESTLRKVRVHKTAWEIELLRENTRLLEEAMFRTYQKIVPGMSETEMYSIWNKEALAGSVEVYDSFHTNMCGTNWSPKLLPDNDFIIQKGDILRLDAAVWRKGYGSDLGRAAAIGGVPAHDGMRRVYDALHKGYERMVQMVGPGVRLCDVFHEVIPVIQAAGIPDYKRGHIGHSLGCNRFSEEYPFIAPDVTDVFEPGMIFCTEVPYYSSDNNSYNLEDTLLITENGIELFSHIPDTLNWDHIVR